MDSQIMDVDQKSDSGTDRESLKKSGTPPPPSDSGRVSPPPDCAICLGHCRNKSFTDSCLHQFCFNCLLTWSKIKAECPLCKQAFKSIIHNVKSLDQYEEYMVEQQSQDIINVSQLDSFYQMQVPRFRYRTTLTVHRREGLAIQRLLMQCPLTPGGALPSSLPSQQQPPLPPASARHHNFRFTVYRHGLWALPLPDVTGRFRECSFQFYRENPAQITRLVPWLDRDLATILSDCNLVTYVLGLIVERLTMYPILSGSFRRLLSPYLHIYTTHFLHELYHFAKSPFDLRGYDRAVQYQPHRLVNEVISSSDTENSTDSDIIVVTPQNPGTSFPMPLSSTPPPAEATNSRSLGSLSSSVIPIESIPHSDTDDSSDEVVMVGYIKPPGMRTPEVVDLVASDSDTVIIEDGNNPSVGNAARTTISQAEQETYPYSTTPPLPIDRPSTSGLVKLSMKRPRTVTLNSDSDSDCSIQDAATRFMKMREKKAERQQYLSRYSVSTECTDRDTDNSDSNYVPPEASDSCESSAERSNCKKTKFTLRQTFASKILKKLKKLNRESENGNLSRAGEASTSFRKQPSVNGGTDTDSDSSESDAQRARPKYQKHKHKKMHKTSDLSRKGVYSLQKD